MTAPGSLYLDPGDGELVQVLPPSAWDPERWGPATAGLTVCRVLASAPRHEATGEVVQRDLRGCLRIRDAAGRVPAALRALAGGASLAGLSSLAMAAAKRADAIGYGFATQAGEMPGPGWLARLIRDALPRGDFAEVAALALFGLSLAGAEGGASDVAPDVTDEGGS